MKLIVSITLLFIFNILDTNGGSVHDTDPWRIAAAGGVYQ